MTGEIAGLWEHSAPSWDPGQHSIQKKDTGKDPYQPHTKLTYLLTLGFDS